MSFVGMEQNRMSGPTHVMATRLTTGKQTCPPRPVRPVP
jgi:hypothetical protein